VVEDKYLPESYLNELPDIGPDLHEDNKILLAIINRGITVSGRMLICSCRLCLDRMLYQLLASTFRGQLAARHLFVVTASSPSQTDPSSNGISTSEWQRVAQRLQEVFYSFNPVVSPCLIKHRYRRGSSCILFWARHRIWIYLIGCTMMLYVIFSEGLCTSHLCPTAEATKSSGGLSLVQSYEIPVSIGQFEGIAYWI